MRPQEPRRKRVAKLAIRVPLYASNCTLSASSGLSLRIFSTFEDGNARAGSTRCLPSGRISGSRVHREEASYEFVKLIALIALVVLVIVVLQYFERTQSPRA